MWSYLKGPQIPFLVESNMMFSLHLSAADPTALFCLCIVDAQVGKILQALDDFGLAKDTIVGSAQITVCSESSVHSACY